MTYRRDLPVSKDPRAVWVYFVSRDSLSGELSGKCSLWYAKPIRVQHRYRVTWVGADDRYPCHLGEFRCDEVFSWFKVYPETDRELIRVEQYATQRMLEAARR